MSHRLGKIHHWLYNQIKLVEGRELEVIKSFKAQSIIVRKQKQ
jgi:hypothetical protein